MYCHDLEVISSNPSRLNLGCVLLLSQVILESNILHIGLISNMYDNRRQYMAQEHKYLNVDAIMQGNYKFNPMLLVFFKESHREFHFAILHDDVLLL